jgi:hypothetical protein
MRSTIKDTAGWRYMQILGRGGRQKKVISSGDEYEK